MKRLIHQVLKKPLNGTFLLTAAILMLSMLSSCKDEASVSYTLALSDDVLEYLEPTVTYTTPSGTETITLTADDFHSYESSPNVLRWNKLFEYNDFDVTTNVSVSFRQIKEIPEDDNSRQFDYLAEIKAIASITHEGPGNVKVDQGIGIWQFEPIPVSRGEFKRHIAGLVENGLTKTVVIDSKGNITYP